MAVTRTTTYEHVFHMANCEEMDYAANIIDTYTKVTKPVESYEFDGDEPFEVAFYTAKPLSRATIKKINGDIKPRDYNYNTQK